jgi:uncharacterized coiled-coil protein SlyX
MSDDDPHRALVDLQSRLTYQERTLETLDAAVAAQARRIDRLQAAVDRFSRRIEGALGEPPAGGALARD